MNNNLVFGYLVANYLANQHKAQIANIFVDDECFYVDFNGPKKITSHDFDHIKQEILESWLSVKFEYTEINKNKFVNENNFLIDILKSQKPKKVPVIKNGNFLFLAPNQEDLFKNSANIKFVKFTSISGVYWKNDINNPQIQRISGYAYIDKKAFNKYEVELQERQERDHRKIGQDLEMFAFDQMVGQGLPIWLENGFATKYAIENYCYELLRSNDYHFVECPVLGTTLLYKTSGHLAHYRENMFTPFKVDNEEFVLKPMNCPHHIIVYKQKPHSYRELPFRVAEFGIQHRYESSGSLTGLERVRSMKLIDTHTVLMPSQIGDEVRRIYKIILEAHKTLGTSIYSVDLSLHDPNNKEKFFDDKQMWASAEQQLRTALQSLNVKFNEEIGEAAFYGPKIDLQIKTALGHIVTVSTIQLDFLLPQRFDLQYIDSIGKIARPVFIHAGIIGTFERYIAILLEQSKGILPLWLSPIQIDIITINNEKHEQYASDLKHKLVSNGYRVKLDNSENRLSFKIREAQIKKIPYQLIIGDNEVNSKQISYRLYGQQKTNTCSYDQFLAILAKRITDKN